MIGPTSEMNIIYNNRDITKIYKDDDVLEVYFQDKEIGSIFTNLSKESSLILIETIVDTLGSYQASKIFEIFQERLNDL